MSTQDSQRFCPQGHEKTEENRAEFKSGSRCKLCEKEKRKRYIEANPLRVTWNSMLQRCNNPKATNYERYGGRGITVCDRWQGKDGYKNFEADMGNKPFPQCSIDRIDNDKGYSPDNCKWSLSREQSFNQRIRSTNISGANGVSYSKKTGLWTAAICIRGKNITLSRYKDKSEAIHDRYIADLVLKATLSHELELEAYVTTRVKEAYNQGVVDYAKAHKETLEGMSPLTTTTNGKGE